MQVLELNQSNVVFSPMLKCYTLDEYLELPEPEDGSYYELIDGVLRLIQPPSAVFPNIIEVLSDSLILYLNKNGKTGRVFPNASVTFENSTYIEADLAYRNRQTSDYIVFQCFAEGSSIYNLTTKADTYLALGVKELWLIDSDNETIEIRNADAQDGVLFWQKRIYTKGEQAESKILEDWKISVSEVFAK
jgi:Uma2 family endonuclease